MITINVKKLGEEEFTNRTDQIEGVSLTQGTTKEATTGSLSVTYFGARYKPTGEDEVEIYDGELKIFGGFIVRVNKTLNRAGAIVYECDLKNKVHRLDYKLVNVSIEDMTAHDAVLQIVEDYSGPGITTANVENDTGAIITSLFFSNIPPSEAIQQIADLFGKEWYVDTEGDIHFFSKFSEEAPFSLTDTNGKYIFDSLDLTDDYTQIKNSVLVEAGDELSVTEETDEITVVGDAKNFPLSRKYTGLTVTVNGTPVTVGTANIHTFDSFDSLYDFNSQSISFNPSGPLTDGDVVLVSGKYYFPIAVRYNDSASIALYGRREFALQERSIKTRADAVSRAKAELSAYASPITEGTFETNETGLRAGQRIFISSARREISSEFVIQRLTISIDTPTKFLYRAELVSVKTFELIDLLAQIIKGNRTAQSAGTVISNAERLIRKIIVQREFITYVNDPPIWVAGPYYPTDLSDRNRPMFTNRGSKIT